MNALIIKSLLTSLCQREGITPPHSSPYLRGGWVGLKGGKGRFFTNDALLMNSLVEELLALLNGYVKYLSGKKTTQHVTT